MPGMLKKYFRICSATFNVSVMTKAPDTGYALGVFRRPNAAPDDVFTDLVRGTRVRDISALGTVNDLLADWDAAQPKLDALTIEEAQPDWTDLADLDVCCLVSPSQILQVGANYRKHVVG